MLRTATYGLQLNMGNELFSTKRWVKVAKCQPLAHSDQMICRFGLTAWTLCYLPIPWGLLWMSCSTLISDIGLLAPGICDSGGSFFFHRVSGGSLNLPTREEAWGLLCTRGKGP